MKIRGPQHLRSEVLFLPPIMPALGWLTPSPLPVQQAHVSPIVVRTDSPALTTYQEEHALLEPLPGELAEAAQADEFLQRKNTPTSWLGACKPVSAQIQQPCEMLPPTAVPFTLKIAAITAPVY